MVSVQHTIRSLEGVYRPDLVVHKGGRIVVVDVQVVGEYATLDSLHVQKSRKYQNVASIPNMLRNKFNLPDGDVGFTSVTLSFRCIWWGASAVS